MSTVAEPPTIASPEVAPQTSPAAVLADLPALESPHTLRPSDAGRRMAFEDFIECNFEDGCLYELARGIIVVAEIPNFPHGWIVYLINQLFTLYDVSHPGIIKYRAGGSECRLRLPAMKCDRHPDQAVYLSPPIGAGRNLWMRWIPDLVVEVVSEGGEERDYAEKREEYLKAGVREYWILNPITQVLHALQRAGDTWEEVTVTADNLYNCPLLPGLEVRPTDLFQPIPTL
jgi:Uma2 family endonuclease